MTLTTFFYLILTFITSTYSLKCHTCDNSNDPLCSNPSTKTCGDKDTLCYTLKYKMMNEVMIVRGCTDNCEKTKQGRMMSELKEECCGSDLCNKDQSGSTDKNVSGFKATTENVPIEDVSSATEKEGVVKPATKKTPKEVLVEVKPRNGSKLNSINILSLLLTYCLHLLV